MSVLIRGLGEKAHSFNLKENNILTLEDLKYFVIKKFNLNPEDELNFSYQGKNIKSKESYLFVVVYFCFFRYNN